ncbi:MAG: hypothetical protein JWO07_669 [Candidatus Saccharibacteria bacterium]|nr:hypothetical protein [Candidatus Saccharibacteria bacterium]
MSCGVTRVLSGVTITCDNTGTSSHTGRHSGIQTFMLFGRSVTGSRVFWEPSTARVVMQKPATLGESDFVFNGVTTQIWTGVSSGGGGSASIDETTIFNQAGSNTYTVPTEANFLDVIVVGGGGGGAAPGSFYTLQGYPGTPGTWATVTLTIGTNIPRSSTSMTVVVGSGGAKGSGASPTGVVGTTGLASTVSATGMTTLSGSGGAGGIINGTGTSAFQGLGPGNQVFNSVTYAGGATQSTQGGAGNVVGGAGAGGASFGGAGGDGARGQVWIRARTV